MRTQQATPKQHDNVDLVFEELLFWVQNMSGV